MIRKNKKKTGTRVGGEGEWKRGENRGIRSS